jgi:hypothetical protein
VRILLDTNILIPLEDSSKALEPHLARFHQLATTNGHQLLVHPASRTDIERDQNAQRRAITLSRLARYPILDAPPRFAPTVELLKLDNDGVDSEILFSLERNAASFLITEDREIHNESSSRGLSDRVLYVQQGVSLLERLHAVADVTFPNIQNVPIYTLNIKDRFFDSLRQGYDQFDAWFARSAQDGRSAWVYLEKDSPKAICIYKREESPPINDDGRVLGGSVLKLCTFKVGEEVRGRRVGELFLKAAFQYAYKNGLEHVYLTMVPDELHLMDLCVKYGFRDSGIYKGRDRVLVKDTPQAPPNSALSSLEYHVRYSPSIKADGETRILLIPIQPRFHGLLFPEISSQFQLFADPIIGNGLILAYLCHSKIKDIKAGDIVVFYRSGDLRKLTTVGVVESAFLSSDIDEILQSVAKRTVYAYPDIKSMAQKTVRVVLFRLAFHLDNGPSASVLEEQGILKGPIQSIRNISINAFKKIIDLAGVRSCFFAD